MKIFLGEDHNCGLNYQLYQIYNYLYDYLVDDVKKADIIIIPSTCVCTEKMILRTISYIDYLYQQNKEARMYVTGCVTRKFKDNQYMEMINNYFDKRNIKVFSNLETGKLLEDILQESYDHKADNFGFGDVYKDKSILYISTGCLNNCSFCKATYQEMPLKSVNIDELKSFIDFIDKHNISNLTIKGTNISQYGYDLYGEYKLPELIEYIENKNNIQKVNFTGFAFKEAIHNNFKSILENSKKINKIDGSLESGSNRILQLIRKGFTAEEFINFIDGLDNIYLSLSIIAGFPTETLEDVMQTLDVLKNVNNGKIQICRYINSNLVDSNNYEQLPAEKIQEHARIYQKVLTMRNTPNKILGSDYK